MTLANSVELWQIHNPGVAYFDSMVINAAVDKDSLFNWLMYEYMDMETTDGDSGAFHDRVEYFFKIHKFNIDKLVETTLLEYNPLTDYKWEQDRTLNRDVGTVDTSKRKTTGQKQGTETSEEDKTVHNEGEWEDERKTKGETINLVSAFNDLPANINALNDTEHDRTVTETKQNNDGTNKDDTTEHTEGIGSSTETSSGTDDVDKTGSVDEDVIEHIERTGMQNNSYQKLIEEERKQAEFNIYKWIGKHFCKELLIAVW